MTDHTVNLEGVFSFETQVQQVRIHGYEMVHKGDTHPWKLSVVILPMTDINHSDLNTIHIIVVFIFNQEEKKFSPIVAFNQPNWWKSVWIAN